MTRNNDKALAISKSRSIQRKTERSIERMRADEEIAEAVIDNGTELHQHAVKRITEIAYADHMMMQAAAQNLNGSYAELEETVNRFRASDFELTFQATVQAKTNMLRHQEEMQANMGSSVIARVGDGAAEILDEINRSRGEG